MAMIAYSILSVLLGLVALATSTQELCAFTHTVTTINVSPEQIALTILAIFNLTVVIVKLFIQLPLFDLNAIGSQLLADSQQADMHHLSSFSSIPVI